MSNDDDDYKNRKRELLDQKGGQLKAAASLFGDWLFSKSTEDFLEGVAKKNDAKKEPEQLADPREQLMKAIADATAAGQWELARQLLAEVEKVRGATPPAAAAATQGAAPASNVIDVDFEVTTPPKGKR